MTTVSVREFAQNPSAMFARVEAGETIEVTRHGTVIAQLVPPPRKPMSRYDEMVASGALRPSGKTAADLDTFVHITVPDDYDPLQALWEDRNSEIDWVDIPAAKEEKDNGAAG